MKNVFLISDTHFGHANILNFERWPGGPKLRDFASIEAHDEFLITSWNEVVKPTDKVYHLGDVVIARRMLKAVMPRLNGDKVLIKGNHDIFKLADYTPWFRDIRAYHKLDRAILSHVPIHPEQLVRFAGNIHGHLHSNLVQIPATGTNELDWRAGYPHPQYLNVCVEHTGYAPIELSEALKKLAEQKMKWL